MNSRIAPSRRGLLAGGNWIVDQVKTIDNYPHPEHVSYIHGQYQGTGGGPYNVLLDLARSGVRFPLFAAGLVGKDELGHEIIADCRKHRIDVSHLATTSKAPTSFTDVMTERATGRRTFFHLRGANTLWSGADLNFNRSKARIFHLAYLLLLDFLDEPDATYGTKAAQAAGMKTSVDVVSENRGRFTTLVAPALRFVDYCILNEFEAGQTTGFNLREPDGRLNPVTVRHAAGALLQKGVRELVVIHFPEGAFARTRRGDDAWQRSLKLPAKYIAGTAGAGDAFCAGVLLGLHEGWELSRCLHTGVCIAAASLSDPTCTAGVKSLRTSLALAKKYGFQPALE
jgi:sugar/nucleoside kinase (ribokinase family)